jgi:hypothetical protein
MKLNANVVYLCIGSSWWSEFTGKSDKIAHTYGDMPSAVEATEVSCHFSCYSVLLITLMFVSLS